MIYPVFNSFPCYITISVDVYYKMKFNGLTICNNGTVTQLFFISYEKQCRTTKIDKLIGLAIQLCLKC